MLYQWYPGHMAKARRMIEEDMKLIDLVIEITDARIPLTSRNPDIDALAEGKARIILLGKADLADPGKTDAFVKYFKDQGIRAAALDARRSGIDRTVLPMIYDACAERIERNKRRGIKNRPMRALIAGIPNVGKSTFINSFAGKAIAKTGNKPGVTKGKQWIRLRKDVELLDSPGILWPRQEGEGVGEKLAMIGTINDDLITKTELASTILRYLHSIGPEELYDRYPFMKEKMCADENSYAALEAAALARGCLKKGGEPDTDRAALLLIDEFRKGILGKVTLDELPEKS